MSRTDKDRPWWVIDIQDPHYIKHDHRNGVCIEENLELAKFYNGGRGYRPHHDCKKNVRVDFECYPRKVNGHRTILFTVDVPERSYGHRSYRAYIDKNRKRNCWTEVCDCGHGPDEHLERWYCDKKYWTGCFGHWFRTYDPSIACSCDDWPEQATCDIRALDSRGGYHRYTWGGVPSWFVRQTWHRPERAREREDLRDMAREYNEYGDIEDDDFANYQHNHRAAWLWW